MDDQLSSGPSESQIFLAVCERLLTRHYGISTDDAGIDQSQAESCIASGAQPWEEVCRLADRFGWDRVDEPGSLYRAPVNADDQRQAELSLLGEAVGCTIRAHVFDDSGEAYNATQCSDAIRRGDVLVIEDEGVVGLANAWPLAVTAEAGEFHLIDDKPGSVQSVLGDAGITAEQVRGATAVAEALGYPLAHWVDEAMSLPLSQSSGPKLG